MEESQGHRQLSIGVVSRDFLEAASFHPHSSAVWLSTEACWDCHVGSDSVEGRLWEGTGSQEEGVKCSVGVEEWGVIISEHYCWEKNCLSKCGTAFPWTQHATIEFKPGVILLVSCTIYSQPPALLLCFALISFLLSLGSTEWAPVLFLCESLHCNSAPSRHSSSSLKLLLSTHCI